MRPAIYVLLGVLLVPTVALVGDIVTDGQFKSTRTTGAGPPIEVLSEAMVPNLNADMVDGVEGTDLYTRAEVDALVNAAGGGRVEIGVPTTFPIVIDQPGSYVLTADLTVTLEDLHAIQIESDDVTLDLAGHVLQGPGAGYGSGVHADLQNNIRIRDGVVKGFFIGVYSRAPSGGHIFEEISVAENWNHGMYVTRAVIVNCNASDNGGTGIHAGQGSVVRDSCSSENGEHGILIRGSSAIGCEAHQNGDDGIHIDSSVHTSSRASGCNVTENGRYGIYMEDNDNNNVLNCVGSNNTSGNIINCGVGNGCHHNYLP